MASISLLKLDDQTFAEIALGDVAIFTNPRPITYDDALTLLRAAW